MATPNGANTDAALPRWGKVGGGVAAVSGGSGGTASVVRMQSDHGLGDKDRVRVGPPGTNGTPAQLYYVKCGGHESNEFSVYSDSDLKKPAVLNSPVGTDVVRLNVEDWAVVAGVNFYPKLYPTLKGALGDAQRFSQWLKTSACLPDDQVLEVPASQSEPASVDDVRPSFDDGKGPFQRLAEIAGGRDLHYLGRRLYIFMSGHGILPAGGKVEFSESALLMAKRNIYDHIAGRAHAELFRGPGVFDEVVLFMDCCRDWKANVPMTQPMIPVFPVDQRPAGRKFYIMATQPDSKSRETDKLCPPEYSGYFTHVLLDALTSPGLCRCGRCSNGEDSGRSA